MPEALQKHRNGPKRVFSKKRHVDLTGRYFGRLQAICRAPHPSRNAYWECRCECGNTAIVRGDCLRAKTIKSCGCLNRELAPTRNHKHGMHKTPTYKSWQAMLGRCRNPNDPKYAYYGGRGIKVCNRWLKFENFLIDMGTRPEGHTLDRVNVNGSYSPRNCRWATHATQQRNRRMNSNNNTGYAGVWFDEKRSRYVATLGHRRLGYFDMLSKALAARRAAVTGAWRS